jgi:ubiquinone biosynthesis monooxygenase Coq7
MPIAADSVSRLRRGAMTAAADRWIAGVDRLLRAALAPPHAERPMPGREAVAAPLSDADRRRSGALMRVNHVGEVCAQALYAGQALAAKSDVSRTMFDHAAQEEGDHLAWTAVRLEQLGAHRSLLNPLWFAGSFALGWLAGRAGDATSLGFVVETERQVEQHLAGHLEALPAADRTSRAIVDAMRADEARHGAAAREAGAEPLPDVVQTAMRAAAKVMTTTAYWI